VRTRRGMRCHARCSASSALCCAPRPSARECV
jgi:hypothetical protein